MKFKVYPYKQGSQSAKALAGALNGKVLKLIGSKYVRRPNDIVINWGSSGVPDNLGVVLNPSVTIQTCTDKRNFFIWAKAECDEVIPNYWTNKSDIPSSVFNMDGMVVARTVLAGHSGAGISIARSMEEVVDAPLYTLYVKKKDEYRIHVGRGGSIISIQRKARKLSHDSPNWLVRNHANGFVYVRDGVSPPEQVMAAAVKVFNASGLDFGAVDVIWNEAQERAYVLEINTAPGLEGQTVQDYAAYFKSL